MSKLKIMTSSLSLRTDKIEDTILNHKVANKTNTHLSSFYNTFLVRNSAGRV